MFRNKFTGITLTDEKYWRLRKREIREEWENMTKKERKEWTSFQEFEEWNLKRNVDLDFEYIED